MCGLMMFMGDILGDIALKYLEITQTRTGSSRLSGKNFFPRTERAATDFSDLIVVVSDDRRVNSLVSSESESSAENEKDFSHSLERLAGTMAKWGCFTTAYIVTKPNLVSISRR